MPITDDFNRANNTDLGTSWDVAGSNPLSIVSNEIQASANSTHCCERYVGTFPNDQYAQVVLRSVNSNVFNGQGPCVRVSAGGNGYVVRCNSGAGFRLESMANGSTMTNIANFGGFAAAAGHVVRIEAIGTTIKVFVNSVERISITDTTYASGNPGVYAHAADATLTRMDDFEATDPVGGTAPGSITDLSATPASGQVNLTWTAASGATSHRVERRTV